MPYTMLDGIAGRPKEFAGSGTLPTPADLRAKDLAYDITSGITYEYDGTTPIAVGGWAAISTDGVRHVTSPDGTTLNGGLKVANVYHPARDIFQSWFFGSDGALDTTFAANTLKSSIWLDQSLINVDARSIIIINGNASPSFTYAVNFSRNGIGSTTDDQYEKKTAATVTSQITVVPLVAADGYDQYVGLDITADAGQSGTQLQFKAYLIGRGG
ncbi:MAG: hypothetical protein BMS9Abin02_2141 [Anaerolineae bacterium]|nr:MAG: hypothetical protein BMS9Abin02_2141 [Anaerolineae bacterium]